MVTSFMRTDANKHVKSIYTYALWITSTQLYGMGEWRKRQLNVNIHIIPPMSCGMSWYIQQHRIVIFFQSFLLLCICKMSKFSIYFQQQCHQYMLESCLHECVLFDVWVLFSLFLMLVCVFKNVSFEFIERYCLHFVRIYSIRFQSSSYNLK